MLTDVQTFHGDSVSPWRHLSLLQFSRVDENGMTLESAAVSECTLLQKKFCAVTFKDMHTFRQMSHIQREPVDTLSDKRYHLC